MWYHIAKEQNDNVVTSNSRHMAVHLRGRCSEATKDCSIPFHSLNQIPLNTKSKNTAACFMWAFLAFIFGVLVGVTLPYVANKESIKGEFANVHTINSQNNLNWDPVLLHSTTTSSKNLPDSNSWTHKLIPSQLSKPNLLLQNGSTKVDLALENKIYFGSAIERALPEGFTDQDVDEWRTFVRNQTVIRLHEGCGRMQNRLLTFLNGTLSCCRYRQNLDQIQGEIFSFYLSRTLGMTNVPPSALGVVKSGTKQWERVNNQLALAQWSEDHPVVLTKFVEGLKSVSIPTHLRSSSRRLHPTDIEAYNISSNLPELVELAQWSDLLIFDYLTANLDRIVNNLYNLQWNPSMMDAPAHNLAQQHISNLLVFLDNESGLLHGYRLLDKYEPYHESLLQSLCVFRKSTVNNIKHLVSKREAGKKLNKMFRVYEPEIQNYLPTIPEKTIQILNERLKRVYKQIQKCKNLYLNS